MATPGTRPATCIAPRTGQEILLHPTGPAIGLMEGFGVHSEQIQLNAG